MGTESKDILEYINAQQYQSADDALMSYAESFVQNQLGATSVIHKSAAFKKILATAIFAVLFFLVISVKMFYHEFPTGFFVAVLVFIIIAWIITLMRFNTARALLRKVASMPDAEIDNVLISECDNMTSLTRVHVINAALVAASVAALFLAFWNPHMIYEKNARGYGVRYYTYSLHPVSHVVIPDTWKGEPVTEIRGYTFYGMDSITQIDLPKGLTEIRGSTFECCGGLWSIVIPEGVTRIGGHAFCDCSSLSDVTVPSTLREIGSSAFRRCNSLREITIPESCYVKDKAFKESPTKINRVK